MTQNVFDADGHVIEPVDLYFDRLDPEFRDRVAVDQSLGDVVGRKLPLVDGTPTFGGPEFSKRVLVDTGEQGLDRFEVITDNGLDAAAMLRALDAQGIDVAAVFPSYSLSVPFTEQIAPDISVALARAYNRWMGEFVADARGRVVGVGLAPLHDPEGIATEIRRAAHDDAIRAVMVRPNPVGGRPIHDPANKALFATLEDLDLPMLLHEGRGGHQEFAGDRFDSWYATHVVSHPFEMMLALLGLIVEGVFDRHPRLRVGILESGTGWLPWWLHRMDEHHERFGDHERPGMQLTPSEYFARHCVIASDTDDEFAGSTIAAVGADHVAWSSDFPHLEVTWPDGAAQFEARLDLDDAARDEVMWHTPCRLFGVDPAG